MATNDVDLPIVARFNTLSNLGRTYTHTTYMITKNLLQTSLSPTKTKCTSKPIFGNKEHIFTDHNTNGHRDEHKKAGSATEGKGQADSVTGGRGAAAREV